MSLPALPAVILAGGEHLAIPLAMLIVFGSAKLLAELFERLHQPGIVGEIVAGILIGPGVLAWTSPTAFLDALAQLGVMFLLFRVGLEVKSSELIRVGATATVVATLGVAVPFFLGWGIMLLWGEPQLESIFTGAAMVATSVGITAQVLESKGLMKARASRIILAAAVIDDVLGLLVLALVSNLAQGELNLLGLGLTAAVAIGFTLLVVTWGTQTVRKIVPRMQQRLRVGEAQFALSMCLLFGLSVAAVYAGVAAIIGAFLAGMALSESVGPRVRDLAHGVTELLVPFFLAGIGLHLDLGALANRATLVLSLVIFAAAMVSKLVGCGLGALSLGRADALRVGVGMIPRGEVGLVVAQLGLSLGVVTQGVYGVVVFMAVATTLIAPPLLAATYRDITNGKDGTEVFRIG
jgi:Kef-type K+ transport system membrane component KefB